MSFRDRRAVAIALNEHAASTITADDKSLLIAPRSARLGRGVEEQEGPGHEHASDKEYSVPTHPPFSHVPGPKLN